MERSKEKKKRVRRGEEIPEIFPFLTSFANSSSLFIMMRVVWANPSNESRWGYAGAVLRNLFQLKSLVKSGRETRQERDG